MNKRVLILTGASDNIGDSGFRELLDTTLPSKQRYAKAHNYDLMCLRSFPEDTNSGFTEKQDVGVIRLNTAMKCLMTLDYDVVFWVDADAIITNESVRVEELISDDAVFYASLEHQSWAEPINAMNTGNFIVVKNHNTKDFYSRFIEFYTQNKEKLKNEQNAINILYRSGVLSNHIKVLGRTLNGVPISLTVRRGVLYQDRDINICPWNENNLIMHLPGLPNTDKIQIMKREFGKYL